MDQSPYRYGPPVGEPYFCDREVELKDLTTKMRQGINVIVLSPRRYGKSSLLRRAGAIVSESGGAVAYANLMGCTTEADVAGVIASAVLSSVLSGRQRAKHTLAGLLARIRVAPQVTAHPDGRVELTFTPAVIGASWTHVLDDAIGILEDVGTNKTAVLVLDEFQVVADLGAGGLGGTFKALADRTEKASFVFSGSQLSVMEKLTSVRRAPLLGMGERIVLEVIAEDPMCDFLINRAAVFDHRLTRDTAREIYTAADAVPNYVQQLALEALNLTEAHGEITQQHVRAAIDDIVAKESGGFAERFETLIASQRQFLKAVAHSSGARAYTKAFMERSGVTNTNAIKKTTDALVAGELLAKRGGVLYVNNPFMGHWLRTFA